MAQSIVGLENVQPYKFSECSKNDYIDLLRISHGGCMMNKPNEVSTHKCNWFFIFMKWWSLTIPFYFKCENSRWGEVKKKGILKPSIHSELIVRSKLVVHLHINNGLDGWMILVWFFFFLLLSQWCTVLESAINRDQFYSKWKLLKLWTAERQIVTREKNIPSVLCAWV